MNTEQRRLVISSVAEIWSQLLSLRFDKIGSLSLGSDGHIIVGPMVHHMLTRDAHISAPPREKCGPFASQRDWLLATANRDLDFITEEPPIASDLQNLATAVDILQSAPGLKVVASDAVLSAIVLEATDLQPSNILVSNDNPTKIVSIIDWEWARTTPIWNVAPRFFNGLWDRKIGEQEGKDLDKFFLDEIRRLAPLWGEAKDRGKEMRNLGLMAALSLWDKCDYKLEN
jgi:hypothetical protein